MIDFSPTVLTHLAPLTLIATLLAGLALGAWAVWVRTSSRKRLLPLPTEWRLVARRALSSEERRVYNQLRLAYPPCIVLPKLPLVRLCQPDTPDQVQYWYDLIGNVHVTFAVCNPAGHVLLVVDIEHSRSHSRRSTKIKESVLAACGIPRVQCAADALPSLDELRALIPTAGSAATVQAAAPKAPVEAREQAAATAPAAEWVAMQGSPVEPGASVAPVAGTAVATTAPTAITAASLDELEAEVMASTIAQPTAWRDSSVFLDPFFADEGAEPASGPDSPADLTDWPPLVELQPVARGDAADAAQDAGSRWQRAPARYAGGL